MLARLSEDAEYFRIDQFRPRKLIFFYGGYSIQFERFEGQIARRGGDHRYLGTDDYTLMFALAKMLFKAREQGDQEAAREKQQTGKRKKNTEPATAKLFREHELPIRRKPRV